MKDAWKKVYLGLGSNLGNRKQNIDAALKALAGQKQIRVLKVSSFYKTKPVGGPKQREFLNAVLLFKTSLSPKPLLKILKSMEKKIGRIKSQIKWGPRKIDLDILTFADLVLNSKQLTIPHALIPERLFVLMPFAEIAPGYKHPVLKKTIKRLLRELKTSKRRVA